MNIPLILGVVIFNILSSVLTTVLGYYLQFAYLSIILSAIGAGLLTTLQVDSGHPAWIGYQFLLGAGIGLGNQQSLIAAQTALPLEDVAVGTAIMMFVNALAAAIFVSVGQNVFTNELFRGLIGNTFGVDPQLVLTTGATELKSRVPVEAYQMVLRAYNHAVTRTFFVAVALSCCALVGALSMQWLSVKGKKETKETKETETLEA